MNRFFICLFLFVFGTVFNISFFPFSAFSATKKTSKNLHRFFPIVLIRYHNYAIFAKPEQSENDSKTWIVSIPSSKMIQKDESLWINSSFLKTLDLLSSAKLVEYIDENPCHDFNISSKNQNTADFPKHTFSIPSGSVNEKQSKKLAIYIFTAKGGIKIHNYSVTTIPTDIEIPFYVKEVADDFYRALLNEQTKKEEERIFLIDYIGKIKKIVLNEANQFSIEDSKVFLKENLAEEIFLTRLNIRDDLFHFPENLVFQETKDQQTFQARYPIRQAWRGNDSCPAAEKYRKSLSFRYEQEAKNLSCLTGWPIKNIQKVMKDTSPRKKKWYQYIWGDQD